MIVLVVTPTRNVEKFLDETIFSIISQAGDFDLHYHIQDSQSSDSTISIIKKWEKVLAEPENSLFNPRISFSWVSEKDLGMYDAINRGFAYLLKYNNIANSENPVMSWINGDDILTHGSLQTAAQFFSDTDYEWVTGISSLIRHDSVIMGVRDTPRCFSRQLLTKGLYDGRHLQFIQQEGTFWRQSLWKAAGQLNSNLKFAGDWDLWRRFAECTELVTLSAVLGFHRRREGQLSGSMTAYYEEVDNILSRQNFLLNNENSLDDKYFALIGRWSMTDSRWQIDSEGALESLDKKTIDRLSDSGKYFVRDIFSRHNSLRLEASKSNQKLKFSLGKAQPDVVLSHFGADKNKGDGALLSRIFSSDTNILSICPKKLFGDHQGFGHSNIYLDQTGKSHKEIMDALSRLLGSNKPRKIFSAPYFTEDVTLTLALKDLFGIPLCTYLIDDQNIYAQNISDSHMDELLRKSDLRLGISRDLCQAYEEKYNLKFWLLPPVVCFDPSNHQQFSLEETGFSKVGVLVGNIWNQERLTQLRSLIRQSGERIDWYANPNSGWLNFKTIELEQEGICFNGYLSEDQILSALRKSAYAIVLAGNTSNQQDWSELTRLSLPFRLPYLFATGNIPIIVIGDRDTAVARFVEEFQLGLICDWTPDSFHQAVLEICSPSLQHDIRQRSKNLARLFSAENIDVWIWRSLEKGKPISFKFEQLGKTLHNASGIITAVEINQLHGTGPLVKRIVEGTPNILSIRSQDAYGGEHDFGDLSLLISHRGLSRQEAVQNVISSLDKNTVSQILCVPYRSDDLITAIALSESQGSPLGAYIMDDQNIFAKNIPDPLMQEFLRKCSLRLATHPELRDAYQDKYGLEFWLLPAVVPDSLILDSSQIPKAEVDQSLVGSLIGSLWSEKWLDLLCLATRDAEISLNWYGHHHIGGQIPDLVRLQSYGVKPCGLLSEIELVEKLRSSDFVLVPTGTMDNRDDRLELSRLSLPGRIIFALATSNTPVIILGNSESPAAQFVKRFGIGVACGYDGESLREAVKLVTDSQTQIHMRQNASSIARKFSAKDISQWLWQSIKLGRPSDLRFEQLFSMELKQDS